MSFIFPEIWTVADKKFVQKAALEHGITIIQAGVYFCTEGSTFRFMSNETDARISPPPPHPPFDHIKYGGDFKEQWHRANYNDDSTLNRLGHWYALIYFNPHALFVLRLSEHYQQESKEKIICQNNKNPIPIFLLLKMNLAY